jgi:hypothetical protein
MKAYRGSGGIDPRIFDLDTRWRWVVSFTPRLLYPQGKSPGTHWIGGWVGPTTVLDEVMEKKNFQPLPGLVPPIIHQVLKRYTSYCHSYNIKILA